MVNLAAALVHSVHFAYIVALFALTEAVLEAVGFAYLCIWVMALTSNRAAQQRLGAGGRGCIDSACTICGWSSCKLLSALL